MYVGSRRVALASPESGRWMSGQDTGTRLPMWVQILIVLVGIGVVVYEVVSQDSPRWLVVTTAMVMMGLLSPDIFDRWRKGP